MIQQSFDDTYIGKKLSDTLSHYKVQLWYVLVFGIFEIVKTICLSKEFINYLKKSILSNKAKIPVNAQASIYKEMA